MLQSREKPPAYKKGKGISTGARLASGVMLTEASRKGELWTVLVVRQYLIFFLMRRVKVRGAVLKKVLCGNLQQFLSSVHIFMDFQSWFDGLGRWFFILADLQIGNRAEEIGRGHSGVPKEWWNRANDNANELDFLRYNIWPRHTSSNLISFAHGIFQVEINKLCGILEWQEDLKIWHTLGRQIMRFTALWPCECYTDSQMQSWRLISRIPSIVLMLTWLTNDTIN
jgi:hypothetical protein